MNCPFTPLITTIASIATIRYNSRLATVTRALLGVASALVLMLVAPPATQARGDKAVKDAPLARTIQVVSVFDYPKPNSEIFPERINNLGDIAGTISKVGHGLRTRGFVLFHNGVYSQPLSDPNARSSTLVWGINDARTACGFYLDRTDHTDHGFFLSTAGVYTPFDLAGADGTDLYDINDSGNFCGDADFSTGEFAFVSIDGVVTVIDIAGATSSAAIGINNANEVVGSYTDSANVTHGYFRDAAGNITAPIDVPGSTFTEMRSLNDNDIIVGRFDDSAGEHSFLFEFPNKFITFDFTGASRTDLNGINNGGLMAGYYIDATTLLPHGILARLQ